VRGPIPKAGDSSPDFRPRDIAASMTRRPIGECGKAGGWNNDPFRAR